MGGKPTYDLQHLQQLVGQGHLSRGITEAAERGATGLHLQEGDIIEAVLELSNADFYKSMEAEKCPGLRQDVYHLRRGETVIYIKLQLSPDGRAIVVQFKEK